MENVPDGWSSAKWHLRGDQHFLHVQNTKIATHPYSGFVECGPRGMVKCQVDMEFWQMKNTEEFLIYKVHLITFFFVLFVDHFEGETMMYIIISFSFLSPKERIWKNFDLTASLSTAKVFLFLPGRHTPKPLSLLLSFLISCLFVFLR